jgi:hypothetical protein
VWGSASLRSPTRLGPELLSSPSMTRISRSLRTDADGLCLAMNASARIDSSPYEGQSDLTKHDHKALGAPWLCRACSPWLSCHRPPTIPAFARWELSQRGQGRPRNALPTLMGSVERRGSRMGRKTRRGSFLKDDYVARAFRRSEFNYATQIMPHG